MKEQTMKKIRVVPNIMISALMLCVSGVQAATVWTDWESATSGADASAVGSLHGVQVNYTGPLLPYPYTATSGIANVWNPSTTYTDGQVDVSPDEVGDRLSLNYSAGSTITFSAPVENPLIAFWSVGNPNYTVDFVFDETPTFVVGGPNSNYRNSSSIWVSGNTVSGREGNGVVMFEGLYTSLSWTSTRENYYSITVGSVSPVPLPAAAWLFVTGLLGLGGYAGLRRNRDLSV
jgi:hypothetical protein